MKANGSARHNFLGIKTQVPAACSVRARPGYRIHFYYYYSHQRRNKVSKRKRLPSEPSKIIPSLTILFLLFLPAPLSFPRFAPHCRSVGAGRPGGCSNKSYNNNNNAVRKPPVLNNKQEYHYHKEMMTIFITRYSAIYFVFPGAAADLVISAASSRRPSVEPRDG